MIRKFVLMAALALQACGPDVYPVELTYGQEADAGSPGCDVDAGSDAGTTAPDAGAPPDSGIVDAGVDAGPVKCVCKCHKKGKSHHGKRCY